LCAIRRELRGETRKKRRNGKPLEPNRRARKQKDFNGTPTRPFEFSGKEGERKRLHATQFFHWRNVGDEKKKTLGEKKRSVAPRGQGAAPRAGEFNAVAKDDLRSPKSHGKCPPQVPEKKRRDHNATMLLRPVEKERESNNDAPGRMRRAFAKDMTGIKGTSKNSQTGRRLRKKGRKENRQLRKTSAYVDSQGASLKGEERITSRNELDEFQEYHKKKSHKTT